MSVTAPMDVKVWLPGGLLFEGAALGLKAVGPHGAFGILPAHIDLVAALVPSVLLIEEAGSGERVFGIDEGLLVKKGRAVEIAVRRGVESPDLATLRDTLGDAFASLEDGERVARAAMSRMEADMVRRLAGLHSGPRP